MTTWPASKTHCFSLLDQRSQSDVYRLQVENNPITLTIARAAIDLHKEACAFFPKHNCATVVKADIRIIKANLDKRVAAPLEKPEGFPQAGSK